MKDYSKMSDFEISGYVSMYERGFSWIEFDDEIYPQVKCGGEHSPGFAVVDVDDYCNNPSDAWLVIHANKISIISNSGRGIDGESMACDGFWIPGEFVWNIDYKDANPLRAAMIVYLMMKDEQ